MLVERFNIRPILLREVQLVLTTIDWPSGTDLVKYTEQLTKKENIIDCKVSNLIKFAIIYLTSPFSRS